VGEGEQRGRHGQAQRLGGLEIDDKLELGWQLHRQVGGLLALENATRISTYKPVSVRKTATVAHHATIRRKLAILVDCRNLVLDRQGGELFAPAVEEIIWTDHEPARVQLDQCCKGSINFLVGTRF